MSADISTKDVYTVKWTTGDTDVCYGRRDFFDLLKELKYRIEGNNVLDGDMIAGTYTVQRRNSN
jgi:hypothetical protein